MRLLKEEDVVKAIDANMTEDGFLKEDITCILEKVRAVNRNGDYPEANAVQAYRERYTPSEDVLLKKEEMEAALYDYTQLIARNAFQQGFVAGQEASSNHSFPAKEG